AAGKPLGSNSTTVAVLDDGIAVSSPHPDLGANLLVSGGYDFADGDANPDPVGNQFHGSEVAGVIAAATNNAIGIAGVAGGNNGVGGVRIMPLRVIRADNTITSAAFAGAVNFAVTNGAKILNVSFDTDMFVPNGVPDPMVDSALNAADGAGMLMLFSAGNNGQPNSARAAFTQPLFV